MYTYLWMCTEQYVWDTGTRRTIPRGRVFQNELIKQAERGSVTRELVMRRECFCKLVIAYT